jgi:ribosomal protein S18 acetylase RimI-like enzyme
VEIDIESDITWRALTGADAPAVAELCVAAETADDEGGVYGAAEIAEELASPAVEPGLGAFGAFTPRGRLIAFAFVFARTEADPTHRLHLWTNIHPAWRGHGVGAELTERSVANARKISELRFPGAPAVLDRVVYERLTDVAAHFEKRGFAVQHYSIFMERPIGPADAAAAPAPPQGFRLVGYAPELAEEFLSLHNEAFVPDHPGTTVMTREAWAALTETSSFRRDLSFGLRDTSDGRLVGYVLSLFHSADTSTETGTGGRRDAHIDYVGTRREYRGHGVASALIAAVMHAAAGQDFTSASLSVRANNPTGARDVYERAGFAPRRTYLSYAKTLD